jgi:type I restriction enzyme S subunit
MSEEQDLINIVADKVLVNDTPDGWTVTSLDKKIDILSGFPFKSSLFVDDSSKIGLIRIRDIKKQQLKTFYEGEYDDAYVVKKGDVLIGMDGDFNITKWKIENALLNQRICKLSASTDSLFNTDFLFYFLAPELATINNMTVATTVKHLSVKDLRGITKPFPPLPEQQKIATILSSVDEVIEKTQAQIDKLKDLKTSMMQELLTKGIGHTEFKDSPMGSIPAEWKVVNLRDVAIEKGLQTGPFGAQLHAHEYVEQGIPVIMPKDMRNNRVATGSIAKITSDKANGLERHKVETGDILFSRRGDIGRFVLIEDISQGWICGTGCLKARLNDSIEPSYLASYLTLVPVVEWLNNNAVGQTMLNLNTSILSELPVILPPIDEQKIIAKTIESLDQRKSSLSLKYEKLQSTKKALMQDLLTGKVRVNT